MEFMKAVNYTGFNYSGTSEEKAKESLAEMKQKTACNMVILVITAFWDSSELGPIHYQYAGMPSDRDILDFIKYAKGLGLKAAIKPMVYFIQEEDKRNPMWKDKKYLEESQEARLWYQEYTSYLLHYADLAQECQCELFFIGSHLEHIQHDLEYWQSLIADVRKKYKGQITYESVSMEGEAVGFWGDVDLIAFTGFYGKSSLGEKMDELSELSISYGKPLILSECGCRSMEGASETPHVWKLSGKLDLKEQKCFFQTLFQEADKHKEMNGIGIWCWPNRIVPLESAYRDSGYSIYGKPSCQLIYEYFKYDSSGR